MKWLAYAGVLALSLLAARADGGHANATDWFDEDWSGFAPTSSTTWSTDAGVWTKSASDASVGSSTGVVYQTHGTELKFQAQRGGTARKSAKNALVKVASRMSFTAYGGREEQQVDASGRQAALALRHKIGGPVFIGWRTTYDTSVVKGYWTELSAPGLVPREGRLYDVLVETDYACTPTRVRYSVDGHILADATGETWFSLGSTTKQASTIGFRGEGLIASLAATEAGARTARATVNFGKLAAPRAGDVVTFESVTTNAGTVLTGELSCRWYLMDAAGRRSDTVLAEGPSCTLPTAAYGHWVTAEISDAQGYAGSGRFWFSELPVCTINVANGVFPSSKTVTHDATLHISGNEEFPDVAYDGAITMHVRGNSTAGQPKRPYKIKLGKKTDLFGLGGGVKSKHWVMLANYFDESLMRNKIAYDLSGEYGLPAMRSTWVDVVINGRFDGCYQLCQQIRVAEERVNIYSWSDAAEKIAEKALEANPALTEDDQSALENLLETNCLWMTTGAFTYLGTNYTVSAKGTAGVTDDGVKVIWKKFTTDISGGYIFELDDKKTPGGMYGVTDSLAVSNFDQTNRTANGSLRVHLAMNTPEYAFTNPEVKQYVWDTWWDVGQAFLSGTGYNTNGVHYTELCDFDSMIGYWLAQYIPANLSALSRYAYKDQGGKLVFGPAWDFDYAFGSLQVRSYYGGSVTDANGQKHYADVTPRRWGLLDDTRNMLGQWTSDPYFTFRLRERYLATRGALEHVFEDGGLIDQYRAKLATSAKANDIRWNNRIGFGGNGDEEGDVATLKRFVREHAAWLDEQFATVGGALTNVTTAVPSDNRKMRYARDGRLMPTFVRAVPNPDSIETDIVDDVLHLSRRPVEATVRVPDANAALLTVYVNGLSNTTVAVTGQSAALQFAPGTFTPGITNFVAFTAKKADGTTLARNAALLFCRSSGTTILIR